MPAQPVVLIGPMAAGKSSLGRRTAKLLGREFIDTDKVIAREHGPIPQIFAERGEAAFRELELRAVAASLRPCAVVALGGGATETLATRERLAAATVVHVTVSAQAVAKRITNSKRPLLAEGGIDAWLAIAEAREPTYRALEDWRVDTSATPITRIADELAAWILEHEHRTGRS